MGGKILNYEAKDILNEGRAEGRVEGRIEQIIDLVIDGTLTPEQGAEKVHMTLSDLEKYAAKKGLII